MNIDNLIETMLIICLGLGAMIAIIVIGLYVFDKTFRQDLKIKYKDNWK